MSKSDRPLQVDIPRPIDERPAWSKVGVVAVVGFAVGILWPRFAGFRVGPGVPADAHTIAGAAAIESARAAAASAAPSVSATPSAAPSAAPAATEAPVAANQELVVVGAGKTVKCFDKRDKKIEDCEKLAFDAIAATKLRALSTCPSALGLEGKMMIGFDFYFEKKELKAERVKNGSKFPGSTEKGIVACAAKEFAGLAVDEIPHKHRRYTVHVPLVFYPPNKHPADEGGKAPADGATDSKEESVTVSWDSALLRKEPKDGEVVVKLVKGTRAKVVTKQGDWYKVESNGKTGWIYRGAVGL